MREHHYPTNCIPASCVAVQELRGGLRLEHCPHVRAGGGLLRLVLLLLLLLLWRLLLLLVPVALSGAPSGFGVGAGAPAAGTLAVCTARCAATWHHTHSTAVSILLGGHGSLCSCAHAGFLLRRLPVACLQPHRSDRPAPRRHAGPGAPLPGAGGLSSMCRRRKASGRLTHAAAQPCCPTPRHPQLHQLHPCPVPGKRVLGACCALSQPSPVLCCQVGSENLEWLFNADFAVVSVAKGMMVDVAFSG